MYPRFANWGTVAPHAPFSLKAYPGAGKSTLFPLRLLKALPGRILLFEPRRVEAWAVAARLAENLGEPLGKTGAGLRPLAKPPGRKAPANPAGTGSGGQASSGRLP
ncbi:hypothetical protein [Thermus altitudinis]|uniref:hypothetical protein n=1 Tax=Thermus altitudinis TaxID=2908145 RepID=UPI001FAAFF79|nr:hypothetical protein [Thermus altitudinis]